MAAGIQQASAGAVITFSDDTDTTTPIARTAGPYTLAQLIAADATLFADLVDNLTLRKSCRAKASINNGSSVDTAATSFKDKNVDIYFDTGTTYSVNSPGGSTRTLELGEKVGTRGSKNGCGLYTGAALSLRGIAKIYDSKIVSTGALSMSVMEPASEIIDSTLEVTSGNIAVGSAALPMALVYNVILRLVTGFVTAIVATYAEKVKVYGTGSFLMQSAQTVRVRDIQFAGSPTTADVRFTGGVQTFAEPTWSGVAPQVALSTSIIEPWRWLRTVEDGNGNPIANCPVQLRDKDGTIVVPTTYTDADGRYTHGTAGDVTQDCVTARTHSGTTWTERGPFTERFNLDGTRLSNVPSLWRKFAWSRSTGAFGDQLKPEMGVVVLGSPAGNPTTWTESEMP